MPRGSACRAEVRIPDRVLGTLPLAEARRRFGPDVETQIAAFRDFNRGAEPVDEVILYDDGRPGVEVGYIAAKSPEVVYGGMKGSPKGSWKNSAGEVGGAEEGTVWVHESKGTYLVGRASREKGKPVTRDFRLIGSMVASDGWLRK